MSRVDSNISCNEFWLNRPWAVGILELSAPKLFFFFSQPPSWGNVLSARQIGGKFLSSFVLGEFPPPFRRKKGSGTLLLRTWKGREIFVDVILRNLAARSWGISPSGMLLLQMFGLWGHLLRKPPHPINHHHFRRAHDYYNLLAVLHRLCSHGLESRSERRFGTWFGPFLIWKPDFSPCERKAVSNQAFETRFEMRKKGRFWIVIRLESLILDHVNAKLFRNAIHACAF